MRSSSMPAAAGRAIGALGVVGAVWLNGKTIIAAIGVLGVGIWSTYIAVTAAAPSYLWLDALLVALAVQAALTATQLLPGGGATGYIAKMSLLLDAYINVRFAHPALAGFFQMTLGGLLSAILSGADWMMQGALSAVVGAPALQSAAINASLWLAGVAIAYLPETLLIAALRKGDAP